MQAHLPFPRLIAIWLLLFAAPAALLSAPVVNDRCPVEPGEIALERHQTEYRGVTISFCCSDCIAEFDRSPESYLAALPQGLLAGSPDGDTGGESGAISRGMDAVWNGATKAAGLSIALLLLIALLGTRFLAGRVAPESAPARWARAATGRNGLAAFVVFALAAEVVSAHVQRSLQQRILSEAELEDSIHYTVFTEYGDPPTPSRPGRDPQLSGVYYRGNDERNPALYNGGHYRTAEFHISLCDSGGRPAKHGDAIDPAGLWLRVRFDRAPGTADSFWTPQRMATIYATRDPGKFHGRREPLPHSVPMNVIEPMSAWEFRYPLAAFAEGTAAGGPLRGIVYLCEQRFDDSDRLVGGRFHYAFQFDLEFTNEGALAPGSDLWMGALYRKRSLRIWEIPESEWLGNEPIPTIPPGEGSKEPRLLGLPEGALGAR